MPTNRIPYAKIAGIIGIILGEIYMVFTVGSPRLKGGDLPISSLLIRMVALSPFFGAFGLAIGTGIGLILDAIFGAKPHRKDSETHLGD